MKKPTKVKLVAKGFERGREFDILHAQNILDLEAKNNLKNWSLPDNSPFTLNNGTIEHRNTNANKRTRQSGKA